MIYLNLYKKISNELKTANIKSAKIDAQVLLEFVSRKSREFLLANPEHKLKNKETKKLMDLIKKRKKHQPIAYLIGHKEFFGLDFQVDKNVLIPRPETEILVKQSLEFIKTKTQKVKSRLKILDVGAGSGNIIISIAKNSTVLCYASDISSPALSVAKKNAKKHKVKIKFIQSNLFENISDKFDLIVANLPYVPENGSDDNEIKYEPKDAIFANDNGSEIVKKFFSDAKKHINASGIILAEIDTRNADDILKFAENLYSSVKIIFDLSKKKRFIKVLT